jgi:co-chaperonin GroES (HSP10)
MDGCKMSEQSKRLQENDLDKFKPLNDWIIIRKYKTPNKSEAGIILLEDRKDYQSKRGTVVSIGPCNDPKTPKPNFKVGDEVMFSSFAGMEYPMPEGYLAMRANEIWLVLES